MSASISEEERKEYMDTIKNFMIEDSRRGVGNGLNYLVALGMSAYTEILGGLCNRNLQSDHEQAYRLFLKNYFDKKCGFEYIKVDKELIKDNLGGLYAVVRSGFVHKFLLTKKGIVYTTSDVPLNCAIIYKHGGDPEITFVASEYFRHFECALNAYYDDLIVKKDHNLIENFDLAVTRSDLIR